MLVTVEELRKGDLILYPSNGRLIMYRLLQDPRIDPKGRTTYHGNPKYLTIRVSCKREIKDVTYNWGGKPYVRKETKILCTKEDHNHKKYVDPNYKQFWIVEREEY